MTITLVLQAQFIPEDSVIRKITGEKTYVLKKRIKVYGPNSPVSESLGGPDVQFIIGQSDGSITAVTSTQEFALDLLIDDAIDLLADLASQ